MAIIACRRITTTQVAVTNRSAAGGGEGCVERRDGGGPGPGRLTLGNAVRAAERAGRFAFNNAVRAAELAGWFAFSNAVRGTELAGWFAFSNAVRGAERGGSRFSGVLRSFMWSGRRHGWAGRDSSCSSGARPSLRDMGGHASPYLVLLVAILAVSFASIFIRFSQAPSLVVAFYRLFFTWLLLLPWAGRAYFHEGRLNRRNVTLSLASGVFLAFHFALWISSLRYTTVASSVVLVSFHPLLVAAFGYLFLREGVSQRQLLGLVLTVGGSTLLGYGDFKVGWQSVQGDLMALGGALMMAGYLLIGRRLRQEMSVFLYTGLVYGTSALALFLMTLAQGVPLFPYPSEEWLIFLVLAFIPTIFGHTLFNWALKFFPATLISVSILGEPVGAALLAYLILGERPTLEVLLGAPVILTGLYLFIAGGKEPKPSPLATAPGGGRSGEKT